MNYYLLEDTKAHQQIIKRLLPGIHIFETPRALMSHLTEIRHHLPRIFILDLEIKGVELAGFTAAQYIRQHDPHAQIIIITSHSELRQLCFQYHISAIDFIDKQSLQTSFQQALMRAVQTAQTNLNRIDQVREVPIRFPNGARSYKTNLNKVEYIASEKRTHYLEIYNQTGMVKVRANLKDISALHEDLVQIHAAYCININYFESYHAKDRTVILKSGVVLPISIRFIKTIRQWI